MAVSQIRKAEVGSECRAFMNDFRMSRELAIKTVAMKRKLHEDTVRRYLREMEAEETREHNGTTKWLVFSDTHAPLHDRAAVDCMIEYARVYKPDGIVIAGDLAEMSSVSHWLQNKRLLLEGKRLKDDIDCAVELAEYVANEVGVDQDKKIFLKGNHDEWLDMYLVEHPELIGLISMDEDMKERGWQVFPYNYRYVIGHLRVMHGMYVNKYHANATLTTLGVSCIYGHTHDHQAMTVSHDDGEKTAISIGCLCDMNPRYKRNKPKRWVHGFATIDVINETGEFFIDFVKIVDGKTARKGVVYHG